MSLKEIRDPGSQPQKHRWFPDSLPTIHSLIRDLKWYSTIQSRVWISIGYPKTALTLAGAKEVHPRKQCPNDLQFRWSNGPNARPTEFVVPCNYEKKWFTSFIYIIFVESVRPCLSTFDVHLMIVKTVPHSVHWFKTSFSHQHIVLLRFSSS